MTAELAFGLIMVITVGFGLFLIRLGRGAIASRRVQIHDTDAFLTGRAAVTRGWIYVAVGVWFTVTGLGFIARMLLR